MPELTKSCSSQPQPAGTSTSTSTSTISSSNNGKRAPACGQQTAASRYLPREVPPRFRQQEQKQLLKRGQPLPTGTLTSVSPAQAAGPSGASPPPLPGAGTQLHPSKLQPGKNCEEWGFFPSSVLGIDRAPYLLGSCTACQCWGFLPMCCGLHCSGWAVLVRLAWAISETLGLKDVINI